ncbi:MAG TPA: DUF3365 domain-containing protein [Polyangia bacterium]|nr:DUF3365 domain-containing protein [Polyangia bacterium]
MIRRAPVPVTVVCFGLSLAVAAGCARNAPQPVAAYRMAADAVAAVIAADRGTYAKFVVERLQNEEKVIRATEHWKDDRTLPLPAQMLRMAAEKARQTSNGMWYALISAWPINKQNGPKTPLEQTALDALANDPNKPYYTEETVRDRHFFTAVYADRAVSKSCVSCHNNHPDSPRHDFVLNQIMGAVVVRLAMN